ncbi:putative reverse transcriptase domain-containing protein [Tanacetum coccineum]
MKLEDIGLNNHNISLSSREVPSFDELEPHPNPLPNFPSSDISLRDKRGPKPPIKPNSPDSFRMKNRLQKSIINGITCESRFKDPRHSRPEYKWNKFHSVNEDEEHVMGPITIMLEIKDAVRDEKLQGAKGKKEMEPVVAACASMAALVAASLVVMCADICFKDMFATCHDDVDMLVNFHWVRHFHFVNEDEEDVMGPITIMSEIKDAVRDEKLYGRMVIYIVSNKNRCKSKKEMEPAADACASMAALAAASLVVMRHFKTLSLDELRSPDFNLLSDQEYPEEEEEAEAMAETMEQYIRKTRAVYGSGEVILFYNGLDVPTRQILDSRGVIPTKTAEDAKKAIQEMAKYSQKWHNGTSRGRSTETSDGIAAIQAQLNNLGREIKKVNEKVYAAQVGCEVCKGPHYTKDCPQKKKVKPLKKPTIRNLVDLFKEEDIELQLQDSIKGTTQILLKSISTIDGADLHSIRCIGRTQYAVSTGQDSNVLYKSRQRTIPFPSSLEYHYCEDNEESYRPKFAKAYLVSPIKDTIPRKEKDPGSFTLPCFINDNCFDNALVDLGASFSVMPLSTYLNLGLGELVHTRLIVKLADRTVKYPKGIAENVLAGIGKFTFLVDFVILDMPKDIKVPLILRRPFLSTARAKIDVYKRKITLRVGEENIIFKSVKPASSLIKRVYMLSLRERMELDLEARLMGETLVLNRSLDPFLEDYIELYDLNEPIELRRNRGDVLMPTIEEGEVIEEFRTKDEDLNGKIDDYPIFYDHDKKIHIDCTHNLKLSCIIGFEFTYANFFPLLYVNMMTKKFHNSIMKYKMVYEGNNVVGTLMNVPIFVGNFSVVTDFAVLENVDAYRDDGIGDVIFGESFLREVGIRTRRFDGLITLYKGDDEIPPLLRVSEEDEKNGISHAYQKLKRFYKGVLNLGPDYILHAKMEEWFTRGILRIQVYVKKEWMFRFEPLFKEGQCYAISNFAIAENSGKLPLLPHNYKISFYKGTVVIRIDHFDENLNGFILELCNSLLDGTRHYHEHEAVDVIGSVVAIGDVVPVQSAAGRKIRRIVVIEDSEYVYANMWDEYAQKRNELGHVVFFLQLGKVKYLDGTPSIHNALFGTKMFINRDLPEIQAFHQRFKELPEYDENQFKISVFTPQKPVVTIA